MSTTTPPAPSPAGAPPAGAPPAAAPPAAAPAADKVSVVIDGQTHQFPKGTNLLEACNEVGANVPFFCYHPGLSAPAVCRQCLVEIKGQPKPVPACYTPVADKMEVATKSDKALEVRRAQLEFTLLNHPIDCPICDKAGECMLQKHYFDWDGKYARNDGVKVHKAKVVDVGQHIVLDQERCILCTRCIRVCDEVAHKHELTMAKRGDHEILTTAPGRRLDNPYSLNTVDVCPVGALTAKDFRFQMRAWELEATESVCPGCATGCNVEVHHAKEHLYRLIPRENLKVNKHWMCDEGRFTYKAVHQGRVAAPRVGETFVEWDKALDEAARHLREGLDAGKAGVGVLFSSQATNEDLHVLGRLGVEHLALERLYGAGHKDGGKDDILMAADKNPNTAGARAIAGPRLKGALELGADLRAGTLKTLLVVGSFEPADDVLGDLGKLAHLVVLTSHETPVARAAHVVLPLAAWAEVDGTFTNKQGFVQRVRRAIEPAGDALPGWEILGHLGQRLGATFAYDNPKAVFTEAKGKHDFMKTAEWGKPKLAIHLRFAHSRG